jgi:hypothetical protein
MADNGVSSQYLGLAFPWNSAGTAGLPSLRLLSRAPQALRRGMALRVTEFGGREDQAGELIGDLTSVSDMNANVGQG